MKKRTGRKVRPESLAFDEALRKEVKNAIKRTKMLSLLVSDKGWSLSDYERLMKWLTGYNRRIEVGLVVDALKAVGADWLEVFRRAEKNRKRLSSY